MRLGCSYSNGVDEALLEGKNPIRIVVEKITCKHMSKLGCKYVIAAPVLDFALLIRTFHSKARVCRI